MFKFARKNFFAALEQLPCKITKQVKKSMLTYNEKSLENLLCLEKSEMSGKTGKINPERRSYPLT